MIFNKSALSRRPLDDGDARQWIDRSSGYGGRVSFGDAEGFRPLTGAPDRVVVSVRAATRSGPGVQDQRMGPVQLPMAVDPGRLSSFGVGGAAEAAADAFHGRDGGAQLPDSEATARVAIDALAELFAGLPKPIRKALAGAKSNASRLSSDRLQGLAEIVQNADDLNASEVRFQLADGPAGAEILASHDGVPVYIADLMGLATPWLSPKADDSESTGRFGIGLMTLQSLGPDLNVHSGHFHFALRSPALAALPPRDVPAPLGTSEWTLFSVPLPEGVAGQLDLPGWLRQWGQAALLFLRHVRKVAVVGADGEVVDELSVEVGAAVRLDGDSDVSEHQVLTGDGARWRVYRQNFVTPAEAVRHHKAHGGKTPIAIGFADDTAGGPDADTGFLHAGLPVEPVDLPFRLSAQFDPLANRQGLDAGGDWNAMLASALADLWVTSALHLAQERPASVWAVVPDPDASQGRWPNGRLGQVLKDRLLHQGLVAFASSLRLPTEIGPCGLAELAVEALALEDVLYAADTAQLAGTLSDLPRQCRDQKGVWRSVLADLAEMGAPSGVPVDVRNALVLLADDRSVQFRIDLSAAAIEEGLDQDLAARACVVDADGAPVRPPTADEAHALVAGDVHEVFDRLGLGRRLHLAYGESQSGTVVTEWLAARGSLLNDPDVRSVLHRLADAGIAGMPLTVTLDDRQLLALRDAVEQLTPQDRTDLGTGLGAAVTVDGFTYDADGQTTTVAAHPADAYIIEKEADSWYVAAGRAPGLVWLDRRYATVLSKSQAGAGMGAQKLFRLLGAQVAPRLVPDDRAEPRFRHSPPGVPAQAGTGQRRQRLLALEATHTLNDHVSPDLRTVLTDLAADSNATRRLKRAAAVIATLARAWQGWGELTTSRAVRAYVQWRGRGEVPAAFLYEAAATAWLVNGRGNQQPPQDLLQATDVNVGHFGKNRALYLHPKLSTHGRQPVLDALGVKGDPPASQLLSWLSELTGSPHDPLDPTVAGRAAAYYQALAQLVRTPGRNVGDVSVQRLRDAFGSQSGLVFTNLGWRRPSVVFTGPPVFDHRAPFAPSLPGTDGLWALLAMKPPGAADARQVLADLAASMHKPDRDTETVMLETWRVLQATLETPEGRRLRLSRLPVWTSQGWVQRPAYVIADSRLAAALATTVPVWRPGGDIQQFLSLVTRLGLTTITPDACSVGRDVSGDLDDDATEHFAAAVRHLQVDLARNDPAAERSLSVPWETLVTFNVVVAHDLVITVDGLGQQPAPQVPVKAYADTDTDTRTLFVTDPTAASRVDGGGQALASLSSLPERRISLPWRAAWDAADDNHDARMLVTAQAKAEQRAKAAADSAAELVELSTRAARDHASNKVLARTKQPQAAAPKRTAPPPRNLIDVEDYELVDTTGTLDAAAASTSAARRSRTRRTHLTQPDLDREPPNDRGKGPLNYTTSEKEQRALRLTMRALGKNDAEVRDIRDQRGVGADAVEDLRRFFELKTHAGPAPSDVTLTDAEAKRALSEDKFFLVIVSNLEQGRGDPTVRFLVDPMGTLDVQAAGAIRLGPLKDSPGLTYSFRQQTDAEGT